LGIPVPEHPAEDESSPVVDIFGSTKRKRAFRFQIEDATEEDPRWAKGNVKFTLVSVGETPQRRKKWDDAQKWNEANPRNKKPLPASLYPEWIFKGRPRSGSLTLSLTGAEPEVGHVLQAVLEFASRVGGLGAKTQFGCGVFRIEPERSCDYTIVGKWLERIGQSRCNAVQTDVPTLQGLFWTSFAYPGAATEPSLAPFLLRYRIREEFRTAQGMVSGVKDPELGLRHEVCGFADAKTRSGALFNISFPYAMAGSEQIRFWGWHPRRMNRDTLTARFRKGMEKCFQTDFCAPFPDRFQIESAGLSAAAPASAADVIRILRGGAQE
jgi:CRISPR type III-B/RAMP module RAMP protein Cmr1